MERLYEAGLHPAISLCIRRRGEVVLNRAIGHACGNSPADSAGSPKIPVKPETPFCIFSASKAITAIVIHMLDERGFLNVGDRVADYIPEFGQHGKEWVTIRHVLTHRAGIPSVPGEYAVPELLKDWDHIVELLCDAPLVSAPGRRLAYHAVTGGFILGEIVRRVTGGTIRQFLGEEVLDPLGFTWMNYGVRHEDLDEVAENAFTGPRVPFPWSRVVKRALGAGFEEATRISNTQEWLTAVVPSGNIVATAEEVSRFFQLLLNGGVLDGVRLFSDRMVRRMTVETAFLELDFTLLLPIRYGSGLMLGTERFSPFGPGTSRAFGHHGFINVFAWADPQRDVAVGFLSSGKPFVSAHIRPLIRVLSRISEAFPAFLPTRWCRPPR
ncbi:MAG: beta-lactamase family protein [Deltaproteobacteria bacterium]|nr:beta-lactamase family protein [Deltaproteobacteria bacterium]